MHLKAKKHIVDTSKTAAAMNQWLVKSRGETIMLVIFVHGSAISTQQHLEEFTAACVRPEITDRAGAIAEQSLRDVVSSLQTQWSTTFHAEAVVWRMWATHLTRSTNRAEWDVAVQNHPPNYIAHLLRPPDSRLEKRFETMSRSAHMVLDCVKGSMADCDRLRRDWEAFGRRIESFQENLETRKRVAEGFLRNMVPPPDDVVPDPLVNIENVEDIEHAE
jgi:hypothetical protein